MVDEIPTVEIYRGVPIHDEQSTERIEQIVKSAIDEVFKLDIAQLAAYAASAAHPPEARLFAAARCRACWTLATEERRRTGVDLRRVIASVAGLDSRYYRSTTHFASTFDDTSLRGVDAVPRETPLPEPNLDWTRRPDELARR